jgi:flagellar assembly protein FliH
VNLKGKDYVLLDYEKDEKKFTSGVPIVNLDGEKKENEDAAEAEQEEAVSSEVQQVIEDARKQAEYILSEAHKQADEIRQAAREEGIQQGREEGQAKAEEELAATRKELEERISSHEKEYAQMVQEIEPEYIRVICSLIQKLTGIIVTDKEDVLLHLIRSGLADMEPSKKYTVMVSSEDLLQVEAHKQEIIQELGEGITIEVQEERNLNRNDCIIETERQAIDCGFQTQLSNLLSTLQMLS